MPASCTIRVRAKRLASSTMTVRTPLLAMRSMRALKPGRSSIGSAPDMALEILGRDHVAIVLGKGRNGLALAFVAVLVGAEVGGRAGPQIGDRLDRVLFGHF